MTFTETQFDKYLVEYFEQNVLLWLRQILARPWEGGGIVSRLNSNVVLIYKGYELCWSDKVHGEETSL